MLPTHITLIRMDIYNIAALVAAALLGEITVSLVARKLLARRNDLQIGEQLMGAINKARQDVLAAYKIIDEMEKVNLSLRTENLTLKTENMDLKKDCDFLRRQLHEALDNIQYLQTEVQRAFPVQRKGKKDANN